MFYEAQLAFNEGGNDGFWRFQLRDKYGRWIKMGGSAMFEFRKPNDKNVYKAKGTFQGNIRRGASIIRVGEGEQLPPGDYEVDSRYIESIKAIINTTSAKPEIVDAPKSVNPDVEKQATEREMVAATVKDLEAGDIVQQSTEEALYGQINSVEHGDTESKINVTWSDGSNYDMTLPSDQKIKVWGVEPEGETVDAPKVDSIWGDAAPNERDVVAAVYARLSADMPVADIAALDPDFATYPDSIKNDPELLKDVAIGAIQQLVRKWNGSSIYDDSTKVLHEVAREHFGISGASPVELTEGSKALMENKEAYKAVLDAIYASTQEMFADAGIEEITVYRGSKTDSSGVRPLSSWTTSEATAKAFAGTDGDTREMTVPVSQILSTSMSGGLGAWNEKEVVLLGPSETVDAPKPKSLFEAPTDPAEIEALKAKAEEQKARVAEVEKEREERLKLKAEQEAKAAESYRMAHRPPGRSDTDEEGVAASLDKIDQVFPKDILDPTKQGLYSSGDAEADKETFDVINSIKGNPDAEVTIYRGVPDGVDAIGAGDWVTLSPSYAQHHVDANVPDGKVISMKVKASELFTNADSINEWGYDPEPETVDAGNVEEAPEVPEATRVIGDFMAAAEVTAALAEKVGELPTSIEAPRKFKKHAARVILDKMLAAGVTLSRLRESYEGEGAFARKEGQNYWDALDFDSVVNKLPETKGYAGFVRVDIDALINPPYDDDTVAGPNDVSINLMKINESGLLDVFPVIVAGELEINGKSLKEIQTAAKEDPSFAGYYGDFTVVGTSESKRMVAEYLTSNLVQNWADTSNDNNVRSLAIQDAAEELFGLGGAAPWQIDEGLQNDVALDLKNNGDTYKAFLQAQYDATQEFFAEEGIKEFVLYRGFTSKFKVDTGYTDTVLRPLSSFSTKKTQAEEFALPGGFDFGYLVEMTVPVKDILSVPGLGFGSYEEKEVVVIGGKKSAFIEML
jgi:hypothetical protein